MSILWMNTGLSFVCRDEDNFKDNSRHCVCCPLVLSFSLYIFFCSGFLLCSFLWFLGWFLGAPRCFSFFFFCSWLSFCLCFVGFLPSVLPWSPFHEVAFAPFYRTSGSLGGNGCPPPKWSVTDAFEWRKHLPSLLTDEAPLPLMAEPLQSRETVNSRCKTTPFCWLRIWSLWFF